ncbi:MAG TPA: hypothetical protein VI197_14630 [Polyangiaceae bacterium]
MDDLDTLAVDRELRKCCERWVGYRRALQAGRVPASDPFTPSRWVLGRKTFYELGELEHDPIAPAVRRWVYRLTEQRVNSDLSLELSKRLYRDEHAIAEPEDGRFTLAALLRQGLAVGPKPALWLGQALKHTEQVQETVLQLWERRQELAARFALSSPDALSAPCENLYEHAERWVTASEAPWQTSAIITPAALIEQALGDPGRLEWPARLVPRVLLDFFADTRLLEALELDPGRLPAALAPTSYMRALARLGAAFCDANAPKDQPFSIAHDAWGLERRRHGAIFGLLLLNAEFLRRHFGASREAIRQARRSLGTSLLIASRIAALRVLSRRAALSGRKAFLESFEERTVRVCRVELPLRTAGVFMRLHDDDPQRFAGLLLGAAASQRLTESHDEDWFRNPRAVDQLRSEAALPPCFDANPDELARGADVLGRLIEGSVV